MAEPLDLIVRVDASSPFVLSVRNEEPFVIKAPTVDSPITLNLVNNLTGNVDLTGPQGEPSLMGLSCFVSGQPSDGETVAFAVAPYDFDFDADLSKAVAVDVCTNEAVFTIKKNSVTVGTITFSAGELEGVIVYTDISVSIGDLITVIAPTVQDPTLSDITFLLV